MGSWCESCLYEKYDGTDEPCINCINICDQKPTEFMQKGDERMSGGSLDYFYGQLREHDKDFGDKELNELVSDLAELFHDREWYLSGDTGVGDWNEAKDIFKAKWFTEHGRQERIEKYLEEIADEVRETFGLSKKYCENCKYWKRKDERYGDCEFHRCCLMHKKEKCKKWEEDK